MDIFLDIFNPLPFFLLHGYLLWIPPYEKIDALHKILVTSFKNKEREVKISVILCTMTTAAKGPIYHILHGFVGAATHTKNSWDFLSVWICHTWPRPKVVRCSTSICHLLKATRRGHKNMQELFPSVAFNWNESLGASFFWMSLVTI